MDTEDGISLGFNHEELLLESRSARNKGFSQTAQVYQGPCSDSLINLALKALPSIAGAQELRVVIRGFLLKLMGDIAQELKIENNRKLCQVMINRHKTSDAFFLHPRKRGK
ncbi:hypothetical protein NPIL_320111 [Nephila pilipes]|uniref:Uncharacterized protein n=1 Tax=Nephila pilipes TaxID=299642 RepID=A0A8X6Q774_NEPPI|nr:hypothetical protein NPIL_320111 [Nephila pilipes]